MSRTRKVKWSLVEHASAGERLYEAHMSAQTISVDLANRYGLSGKTYKKLNQLLKLMSEVRSELDDRCCRDWPDHFVPHIYYPGPVDDESRRSHRQPALDRWIRDHGQGEDN